MWVKYSWDHDITGIGGINELINREWFFVVMRGRRRLRKLSYDCIVYIGLFLFVILGVIDIYIYIYRRREYHEDLLSFSPIYFTIPSAIAAR